MQGAIRIAVGLVGALFTLQALRWVVDPAGAAAGLGMPLLDGLARSTQIGDTGAFFLGMGAMLLIGAATARRAWVQAAALLLGAAAGMRVLAWGLHRAPFAKQFIAVELIFCVSLLVVSTRLSVRD